MNKNCLLKHIHFWLATKKKTIITWLMTIWRISILDFYRKHTHVFREQAFVWCPQSFIKPSQNNTIWRMKRENFIR